MLKRSSVLGFLGSVVCLFVMSACGETAEKTDAQKLEEGKEITEKGVRYAPTKIEGIEALEISQNQPEYAEGRSAMYKFMKSQTHYPKEAADNNISGLVFVRFLVNTDGKIKDVYIKKGLGFGCDAEAVRVIRAMPDWIPGKQNGKAVAVYHNLQVAFQPAEEIAK